jgi:predicted Zn finger-like uncharacterized protein
MIVTCEACFTNFNVNDEFIKPTGSKVRCSKCQKVFKVFPYVPEEILDDVSPLLPTEISDKIPRDFISPPPLFETPSLDEPDAPQMTPPDHLPEAPDSALDFTDIAELDFSGLDKLLHDDDKDRSDSEFVNLQQDKIQETLPASDEPLRSFQSPNNFEELTEYDLSDISLELPSIKNHPDESPSTPQQPDFLEFKTSDQLIDNADESLDLALSELSLDEIFADAENKPAGVDLISETKEEAVQSELQEFSLDDFEKSLEMDLSDLSLDTTVESETAADKKAEIAETTMASDQKPEVTTFSDDSLINLDDIQALDLSDIESLLEKQEAADAPLSNAAESFARAESVIVPPPGSSAEPELTLEMEDRFLTFDELQLDTDGSKSDTIQERKESFQPPIPEISHPPAAPSIVEKPIAPKPVYEDQEKEIPIDTDIDKELEDTTPEPKKGLNAAVLIAIILSVIALAAGGYLLLNTLGIAIPFIGQPAPKVSDLGNVSIKPFDINSRFVENDKMGKIFVITGKVKNGYSTARGFIQVTGKIYTKDKALAKTETIYCGNIISDADLAVADAAMIQQRLQNRSGDNGINQKVLPGNVISFMIIFTNLPSNLDEFTTEVATSVVI